MENLLFKYLQFRPVLRARGVIAWLETPNQLEIGGHEIGGHNTYSNISHFAIRS